MPSCAIFRLGYLGLVHETPYHGNFLTVSYTAAKLGKPTHRGENPGGCGGCDTPQS